MPDKMKPLNLVLNSEKDVIDFTFQIISDAWGLNKGPILIKRNKFIKIQHDISNSASSQRSQIKESSRLLTSAFCIYINWLCPSSGSPSFTKNHSKPYPFAGKAGSICVLPARGGNRHVTD